MQQCLKRALNILVLVIAYVRINVFSFLWNLLTYFTSRYAIKCLVVGKGSPYTLVHKVLMEEENQL